MDNIFKGAFDTLIQLPEMFRNFLGGKRTPGESTLEDGLIAGSSLGSYQRAAKRLRLCSDADDSEHRYAGDGAVLPVETSGRGHCHNCGVQVGLSQPTVSAEMPTNLQNSNFDANACNKTDARYLNPSAAPLSIAETDGITTSLQPEDEESSSPAPEQIQERYEPYADNTHVVLNNDGVVNRLAILLTKDMALQIRNIGAGSRALDRHEHLLREAEDDLLSAKAQVCGIEFVLRSVEDAVEHSRLQHEADCYREAVREAEQRKSRIEQEIDLLRINGGYRRDRLQHQLENVLAESGLLDLSSLDPPAIEHQAQDTGAEFGPNTSTYGETVQPVPDAEDLLRCAAQQEVEEAFEAFYKADNDLDNWQQHYWNEEEEYNQMVAEGTLILSRTEFDLNMYQQKQQFTRTVIDAEERSEMAIANAKALGLDISGYRDHELMPGDQRKDNGYRESQEAAIVNNLDHGIIHKWLEGFHPESPDSPSVEPSEPLDVQKHETKSVGVSSCDSMVAGYSVEYGWLLRDRIASWKEHCSLLTKERL